jgi:hypothetical protein
MEISRLQTIPGFSRFYLQPNFYAQEERKSFCSLISVVRRANRLLIYSTLFGPFV